MGYYTFRYINDDSTEVGVRVSDESWHIANVLEAFEQFLLGCTFQRETIHQYVDVDAARQHRDHPGFDITDILRRHCDQ